MKTASMILAALCGLSVTVLAETADILYHGGPVITINDAAPRAEAVAVKNGKILAVGKKDDLLKTRGANTKLVDLAGRTPFP